MSATDEAVTLARARAYLASGRAREIRERARLSQADVARAIGVEQPTVGYWESGRKMPQREHAIRYAAFLLELEKIGNTGQEDQWAS